MSVYLTVMKLRLNHSKLILFHQFAPWWNFGWIFHNYFIPLNCFWVCEKIGWNRIKCRWFFQSTFLFRKLMRILHEILLIFSIHFVCLIHLSIFPISWNLLCNLHFWELETKWASREIANIGKISLKNSFQSEIAYRMKWKNCKFSRVLCCYVVNFFFVYFSSSFYWRFIWPFDFGLKFVFKFKVPEISLIPSHISLRHGWKAEHLSKIQAMRPSTIIRSIRVLKSDLKFRFKLTLLRIEIFIF